MRKKKIEGVIFDLGSTLIYFDGVWPEVIAQADGELYAALQAAGLCLERKEFLAQFRERMDAYYREREAEFVEYTTLYILRTLLAERGYPQVQDEVLTHALEHMYAVSQSFWKAEQDTKQTLEALRQRGYRLALISNAGDDRDVQVLVDQAQIREYFDLIVTSAALGIRKPNPAIFQVVLDYWKLEPTQTVMVGDTLGADILGARNAGIHGIWINRRADTPANRAHVETIRPDAVITNLDELLPLLEAMDE